VLIDAQGLIALANNGPAFSTLDDSAETPPSYAMVRFFTDKPSEFIVNPFSDENCAQRIFPG